MERQTGLRWDPTTRQATTLVENLAFANGVALAEDGSYVLVAETNHLRILKHWLHGPLKGKTEVFIDKLPGLPDGVSRASNGDFWVAIISPASPLRFKLGPYKWLRQILSHLFLAHPRLYRDFCSVFHPTSCSIGCVLRIQPSGSIVGSMWDMDGRKVSSITAVTEHDNKLFFGNLKGDFVSVLDLDE